MLQLWHSPLSAIPQKGWDPRLVYGLSWSDFDVRANQAAPKEAMYFGRSFYRIIDNILVAEPNMCPPFLGKVNLVDTYMHI